MTDPLTEAREALRAIITDPMVTDRWCVDVCWPQHVRTLARLDALPAPVRGEQCHDCSCVGTDTEDGECGFCRVGRYGPDPAEFRSVWIYPDAPA